MFGAVKFFQKNKSIKQNRINVRAASIGTVPDKKRAKLVFQVVVVVITACVLWYGFNYTKPNNFPINNVKIFATYEHVDQDSLQKTIAPYLENGFFYLNVIWMKQQLLKQPWIYSIAIRRAWPDTVVVNVVEQKAILQWGMKALINSAGDIFTPEVATFPQGLPMIFGPEGSEAKIFTLYHKVVELYKPLDLTIKQLILNPQRYWEVVFSNNMVVYLKEDDPLKQLELLAKLYKKITAEHDTAPKSIDLRYRTGLAVKWS